MLYLQYAIKAERGNKMAVKFSLVELEFAMNQAFLAGRDFGTVAYSRGAIDPHARVTEQEAKADIEKLVFRQIQEQREIDGVSPEQAEALEDYNNDRRDGPV